MVSPKTQKILIVIIVLLLLGFLGYKLYIQEPAATDLVVVPSESEQASQEILVLVAKLNAITIDPDFFSSSLLVSLVDYNQTVYPEIRGRANPFATIGSDYGSSAGAQTQTASPGLR